MSSTNKLTPEPRTVASGVQIFRNAADPHETVILLTWDTLVRARLYTQSDDWLDSIARGGVIGRPDLCFLDDAP